VWAFRKYLQSPLSVQLSDVDLALRIEDRYPGFQDSLASSVQFIRSGADPRIGSPDLQQAVVASTLGRLDQVDCSDVVDTRQVRRVAAFAVGVCLATILLAGLNQSQTSIAVERLLRPFSGPAWPRKVSLRLLREDLSPLKFDVDDAISIARGDTFKVLAENAAGRLPPRVTLEYRLADRKILSEAMRPTTMNAPATSANAQAQREVAVGQLPSVKGELEFRVVGGDDDQMAWHKVLIVPPPAVEKLQVTVTPPKYTGRPPEQFPEGVGHIQGLVWSRVTISATVNKPVKKAVLRANSQSRDKVNIQSDGKRLEASFLIREAGVHSWWLELQDAQGFEDAEPPRYEVRGVADMEPEIFIDLPAADMQITADAVVRVRTTARDDLGIKAMRLVYKIEPGSAPADTPQPGGENPALAGEFALFGGDERPLTHTAEYVWKIAELASSSNATGPNVTGPGARIQFHTEATDDFDMTADFPDGKAPAPHVGRSVMRTLTIVTREEKTQEIAQRQEGLLADLERANKLEQTARAQVDDLVVQLETADKFRAEDLDTLQRTELGQREIAAQLNNPASGLSKRARELSDELRNNQINDPQAERRLTRIADELDRISREHLAPAEQELTQARKLLQSPPRNGAETSPQKSPAKNPGKGAQKESAKEPTKESAKGNRAEKHAADRPQDALRKVSENQGAVLESIGEMLHDLSQWRQEHDAAQELSDLIRQQTELNQRSAEVGQRTLTKPSEQLTPQERADLGKIAERQKKQADLLEQLEAKMRSTIENISDDDPSAAAALKDAAEQSQQGAIAGQMRDAAGQIGGNKMGQAARSQQEILQKLHDVEDVLRQHRESDSEMLVKKLKQAESELANLRDRQAELMQKMQAAGKVANPEERQQQLESLRQEQKKLQEETARLARRLARLEARKASTSADRAASRMQKSQDDAEDGDSAGAAQEQQEALDDLEQAQRELAKRRREEEETLAREQLARIADELAGLVPRQQAAIDEARRLNALYEANGKWTRTQSASLRDLTQAQRNLVEESNRIAEKLSAAEVFALALKGAVTQMKLAADRLAERDAGALAQKPQEAARKRLVDLVEALKSEPPGEPGPPEGDAASDQQGGGSGGRQEGPPTDGIPTLAQIKMLIVLQRDLSSRTAELEQLRGKDGHLPPSAQEQLDAIAQEQGELADLVRNLSSIASDDDDSGADDAAKKSSETKEEQE